MEVWFDGSRPGQDILPDSPSPYSQDFPFQSAGIMKQDDYKETLKSYFENTKVRCGFSEVDKCFNQVAANVDVDLILQKYLGEAVAESPQPRRRTIQVGKAVEENKLSIPPSPGSLHPWALPLRSPVAPLSSEKPLVTAPCRPHQLPEKLPPLRSVRAPELPRQPPQPRRHIIQEDEAFKENQLSTPSFPGPRSPWALPLHSPVTPLSSLNSLPTAPCYPHQPPEESSPSRNIRAPKIQKQEKTEVKKTKKKRKKRQRK
ncbi:uncharacterized protein [Lepisosteus oculatus]|uniref:uncharacterized protein isoform X2 n=1 Tax=Lepisosteus oculatus TaxID=7918 RepID=UPI0035F52E53